jgi:hypothetical protein
MPTMSDDLTAVPTDLNLSTLVLAGEVGAVCLTAQCILTWLFTAVPGFWRKQPAFVAHQLVALPLMLYVAYFGCTAWLSSRPASTEERIFGHDPMGCHLSTVLLGSLVLWDIPFTFVPSIYSREGLAHHVGLAVLATLTMLPFLQFYGPFFAGVVEVSSVPLQVVDFFHPKHFAELLDGRPTLSALNTAARIIFAVSFLVVRTLWFPIVVGFQVAPDLLSVASDGGRMAALAFTGLAFAIAFTLLQWYAAARQLRLLPQRAVPLLSPVFDS